METKFTFEKNYSYGGKNYLISANLGDNQNHLLNVKEEKSEKEYEDEILLSPLIQRNENFCVFKGEDKLLKNLRAHVEKKSLSIEEFQEGYLELKIRFSYFI